MTYIVAHYSFEGMSQSDEHKIISAPDRVFVPLVKRVVLFHVSRTLQQL